MYFINSEKLTATDLEHIDHLWKKELRANEDSKVKVQSLYVLLGGIMNVRVNDMLG
jgi:LEA14-like dessication related protein